MKLGIQLTKVLVRGELKNSLSWCYSADVPFFFVGGMCLPWLV